MLKGQHQAAPHVSGGAGVLGTSVSDAGERATAGATSRF